MKRYQVQIIDDAEHDLFDIFQYVASHDSFENATNLLDELQALCLSLSEQSLRGHIPPELDHVGITDYREVHFKPYRAIYEVVGNYVYIHCVLDGRRDIQSILQQRLIR